MDDYPLIADHGLIGDLQTAALVTTDGSIDWFCAPRFDSPSVFGALLDREGGGHFRIRPVGGAFDTKQLYFPDTAILITRFLTEAGVGEIVDFMPVTSTAHGVREPPDRAAAPLRPGPDDVRRRHRPAVRLRTPAPQGRTSPSTARCSERRRP